MLGILTDVSAPVAVTLIVELIVVKSSIGWLGPVDV
jgi:hypothetical protein